MPKHTVDFVKCNMFDSVNQMEERERMQQYTAVDEQRYSKGAIVLHWLLALLLAFELGLGFAMPKDASGFALYQLHKSVGILILLLTLLRIGWRLTHRQPPALERGLTGALAKAVHLGFYAFMILAPLSGWALVSAAPVQVPTVIFGAVGLPHLPLPAAIYEPVETTHAALAWLGLALFALHVAGALRHHLFIRDDLMKRMAPNGSAAMGSALGVVVIVAGAGTLLLAGQVAVEDRSQSDAIAASSTLAQTEANAPASVTALEENLTKADEGAPAEQEDSDPSEAAEAEPLAPPVWTIQPGGRLAFSVNDGNGGSIDGHFARWNGTIRFDPERPESAEIAIEIDLSSASVGDPTMDEMLKGEEFLAVSTGPTARYRTSSVRALGNGRYRADGTLSLRGIGRTQQIAFTLSGADLRRHVEGSATIDRTMFGIGTGSSAAQLGKSVAITFSFDAVGREAAAD
jgi:cytochrome b561/polyisoprenoid-binding protein YceI